METTRNTLKGYFKNGTIPNQDHFTDLIDSNINLSEDGISKVSGQALKVEAGSGSTQELVSFYGNINDANPTWGISQKSSDSKTGLNIHTGGESKLFVEKATGNVGIDTTATDEKLTIFDGNLELRVADNNNSQSILFRNSGGYYVWNIKREGDVSPDLIFTGGADTDKNNLPEIMRLTQSGKVLIGTSPSPSSSKLDIAGNLKFVDGDRGVVFTDDNNSGALIELLTDNSDYPATGLTLRTHTNPASGDPIFRVLSEGGAERLRVEHEGYVSVGQQFAALGTGNSYFLGSLGIGLNPGDSGERVEVDGNLKFNGGGNALLFKDTQNSDSQLALFNGDSQTGLTLKAFSNPSDSSSLFRVVSPDGTEGLRVEHNGHLTTSNNLGVEGGGSSYVKGKLGIGHNAPTSLLHLKGSGAKILVDGRNGANSGQTGYLEIQGARDSDNNLFGSIRFSNYDRDGADTDTVLCSINAYRSDVDGGGLKFYTGREGVSSEAMAISKSGHVYLQGSLYTKGVKPIEFNWFYGFQGSVNTGYSTTEWNAAVVGFKAVGGDINESDVSSSTVMIQVYPKGISGEWHIVSDFRSHSSEHEVWDVKMMFVRAELSTRV